MFKDYNQSQSQLLPPNLSDMVSKDHIARLINHSVDRMDLSYITDQYSTNGQKAYDPRMLLKILVYGYASGARSSRKIADRLKEDIVFMWLAGRSNPDFRTISDFRKDKLGDFKNIFEQVLETCFSLGLVRVGKVSIDGTKILASASRNKAVYRKVLAKRKEYIKDKVDNIIKEAEELDRQEDELYGNATINRTGIVFKDKDIDKAMKKITREKKKLDKQKMVFQVKTQEVKAKERKMRKDRNSFISTDKDATIMRMKEDYSAPGYNVQLATERQIILSYGVYSDRNDLKLLKPVLKEIEERTKRRPDAILADKGYGYKMNYRYLRKENITSFMPYNNYDIDRILINKKLYERPKKIDKELEKYKLTQLIRLQTEEGKKMLKRRRQDVEPTFGDLKRNLGFRRFTLRGKHKCEIELGLFSLAHNFKKIQAGVKRLIKWQDGRQKTIELGTVLGYIPA
jgi:transposase